MGRTLWPALISIHAPREGSDIQRCLVKLDIYISIHAPREGSDSCAMNALTVDGNFNPRSP